MLKKMTEIDSEGNRWTVWKRGYPEVGRDTMTLRW